MTRSLQGRETEKGQFASFPCSFLWCPGSSPPGLLGAPRTAGRWGCGASPEGAAIQGEGGEEEETRCFVKKGPDFGFNGGSEKEIIM